MRAFGLDAMWIVAGPATIGVAALRILFDSRPLLRSGFGDFAYFCFWIGSITAGIATDKAEHPGFAANMWDFAGFVTMKGGEYFFSPSLDFLRELRLSLDPALECPPILAPLIDPNEHSCGSVRPHGARELSQPEAGFYFAGMKSYGRAPTFLMMTGYEQVRSVADALAGDMAAADRVELVYGLGTAWAGLIQANADDFDRIAELPKVEAIFRKLTTIAPDHDHGSGFMYLGVMSSLRPEALGGNPAAGRAAFEQAIARSSGLPGAP